MISFETEFMEEKWQKEFVKLEENFHKFGDYFEQTKKCECDMDDCRHFDSALNKMFGEKIDYLWNMRLHIGFRTYKESIEPILKDKKIN